MINITKETLEQRRAEYKKGTRVELISMNDPYTSLKSGDLGTVDFVDDTGSVFVNWDNGSTLGAVYGVDSIKCISKISDTIKTQILAVRNTGKTNMFDIKAVFEIAMEMSFHELADFIFMDTKAYTNFILTGETA